MGAGIVRQRTFMNSTTGDERVSRSKREFRSAPVPFAAAALNGVAATEAAAAAGTAVTAADAFQQHAGHFENSQVDWTVTTAGL